MAGHSTTCALRHSYEAYLITVLHRTIGLCLPFSFADIWAFPTLSRSFAQSQSAHSLSERFVQPLVLLQLDAAPQHSADV